MSLVLHPRRDVGVAIGQVTAWAERTGVELAAVADGRLPDTVRRCAIDELADGCDVVLALGGDGTMLGGLRLVGSLYGITVVGHDYSPSARSRWLESRPGMHCWRQFGFSAVMIRSIVQSRSSSRRAAS